MRARVRSACLLVGFAVVAAGQPRAAAQEATLADVLARAGAYVTEFQRRLSGVVAEETYVQDIHDAGTSSLGSRGPVRLTPTHRALKSDLLLVRPSGADRWVQFRDVFEVDGTPVRDRSERLTKLFLEPTSSTAAQVDQIVAESARYNIGNIMRTINLPLFALLALEPRRQGHFKFTRARPAAPPAALAASPDRFTDTWTVRYDEVSSETLITTTNNRDLPCRGRFWVDPASGRVLATELVADDVSLSATIVVLYDADVLKDVIVPTAMHEHYLERRTGVRIDGAAAYSRFRQFQVKVDEKIAPIKQ